MGHFALSYLDLALPIFITCSPGDGHCLEGHRNERTGLIEYCPPDKMGKKPLVRWARFQDVLPPRSQAIAWWRKWPFGNIAMATGRLSGTCVVDIDGAEAMKLATALGFSSGPSVITGKIGGRHLYFAYRPDAPTIYAKADGIDFRGHGGYVLLPPSRHATGTRYRMDREWGFDLDDLPELPYWVDERAQHARQWTSSGTDDVYAEGERNARLASLAGRWRKQGMSPLELYAALSVANQSRCRPPLEDDEVRQIAESVGRYEPNPDDEVHVGGKSRGPNVKSVPPVPGSVGTGTGRSEPQFWTYPELEARPQEVVPWVVRGLVGPGLMTELDGPAKLSGKTTFALAMIQCLLEGREFIGLATERSPIVYLTEQTWLSLRPEVEKAGLLENPDVHNMLYQDTGEITWPQAVELAIAKAEEVGAKVMVVDTAAQWTGLRGDQENDSGRAYQALEPLQEATAKGIGVLLIRHDRKSGGGVGESARGSSAYAAIVDIILHLTPMQGDNAGPRQRVLECAGRFQDDTPGHIVIELSSSEPYEYVVLGAPEEVAEMADLMAVLSVLPTLEADALTSDEVRDLAGVRNETVGRILLNLVRDGRAIRVGFGDRRGKYKYYQRVVND